MTCVILTTDTKHHRYFANRIARRAETIVFLERGTLNRQKLYWNWVRKRRKPWALIDNPYFPLSYPWFNREQDRFEERFFSEGSGRKFEGLSALYDCMTVNEPAIVERIGTFRPDLIVSFGTGLLKDGILGIPGLKVNIHRGILPQFRGLDSDLWAFYSRDFQNIGTTVHRLEARFDTGDILRQAKLKIEPHMKAYQMRYYTTVMAADMIESLLLDLQEGRPLEGLPQDHSQGRYFSFIPPLKRIVAVGRFNRYVKSLAATPESEGASRA